MTAGERAMADDIRVRCPACRRQTVYSPSNPWRPFCSQRCRGIDLGAWASEDYRVPAATPDGETDDGGDGDAASGDPRH